MYYDDTNSAYVHKRAVLFMVNMHYWREQLCRSHFGNFIIKYAPHSSRPVTESVHEIIDHVTDTSVALISPRN